MEKIKFQKSNVFAIYCTIFQNGGYFSNIGFSTIAPKVLHPRQQNQVQLIRLIETIIFVVLLSFLDISARRGETNVISTICIIELFRKTCFQWRRIFIRLN